MSLSGIVWRRWFRRGLGFAAFILPPFKNFLLKTLPGDLITHGGFSLRALIHHRRRDLASNEIPRPGGVR